MKKNIIVCGLMIMLIFMGVTHVKALDGDEVDTKTLWDTFVEKYKNTSLVKEFTEPGRYLNVVATDNSLEVTSANGLSYLTVNFTYNNGILTYIPSQDKLDRIAAKVWVDNCLYALADMRGTNVSELKGWVEENYRTLTLTKDGIEVTYEDYECEEGSFWLAFIDIKGKTYTSFKLDLREPKKGDNPVTPEEPETPDEVVTNPTTGINKGIGIALIGLLAVGTFAYVKSKKISKFPQA